jgi:hypothetical protein
MNNNLTYSKKIEALKPWCYNEGVFSDGILLLILNGFSLNMNHMMKCTEKFIFANKSDLIYVSGLNNRHYPTQMIVDH